MTKLKPEHQDRLEQETIEWLVRLNSGEAKPEDYAEFAKWRQRSPAHQEAYLKISGLWESLEQPLLTWQTQQMSTVHTKDDDHDSVLPNATKASQHNKTSRRYKPLAFAVICVLVFSLSLFPDYLRHPFADFRTHIGEQRSITLADGSIIHLNTDTAINTAYTAQIRSVEILQGEAKFEVAHDVQRPFVVTSGPVATRALGTKFLVRYEADKGQVTLLEGNVESRLINHSPQGQGKYQLKAGQQIMFTGHKLSPPQTANINAIPAWQQGRLMLNFVNLADAIQEINRYRRGTVKLLDNKLAEREINAAIDLKHIDTWLDALESTLPLTVLHLGPVTLIRSNSSS